ncbi:MAG: DNA polymerase II [Kiritimatiellae bacterium]|nr:DNA polymerase II [Kiritimatiellia bacterium]
MTDDTLSNLDPMLYGVDPESGIVAAEHRPGVGQDEMLLFVRRAGGVACRTESFRPFIFASAAAMQDCPVACDESALEGGGVLNRLLLFNTWTEMLKARKWLSRQTRRSPSAPDAPYLCLGDPVQQYLMSSGKTLFGGMRFDDLHRMQVDIECLTTEGYDFCNAEREDDCIVAIALSDETGWTEVLSGKDFDEATLLSRFVEIVQERDPDVLEGHNLFNFDLPYIAARAKRFGISLALGRDGRVAQHRPSRVNFGERTISYDRFDIFGRHVIDTFFLVQAYDISSRSLPGYGLKQVAAHFGLASADRTYIEGREISREFKRDPDKVIAYCRDDVIETREISRLLSHSYFVQTSMLPYSYQNVMVRGSATKIDALMIREYLRRGRALPIPGGARSFSGGYTDMFEQGVIRPVHHCDVRSLYPSLMLTRKLAPASDDQGVFLLLLEQLKRLRLSAKQKMQESTEASDILYFDALQSTFKILINSFYGYLGFSQARFGDFDAAERVAADGRDLLQFMIDWMREHGARPVEIDTDGIYFVPPGVSDGDEIDEAALQAFRARFAEALPDGIEIEFDGEYRSMYSYKMKNYALLDAAGKVTLKGAALKSRGLEPFQREFLGALIRLKLEGRDQEAGKLRRKFESAIRNGEKPIQWLAKTERLQDAPSTYQTKLARGKRARNAGYELALRAEREYRAGDQVAYYVTGTRKTVAVYEAAKLLSDWNPAHRDENTTYYLGKLEALCKKFDVVEGEQEQTELAF